MDSGSYVSNGALIAATLLVGLPMTDIKGTVSVMIRFANQSQMNAIRCARLRARAA